MYFVTNKKIPTESPFHHDGTHIEFSLFNTIKLALILNLSIPT